MLDHAVEGFHFLFARLESDSRELHVGNMTVRHGFVKTSASVHPCIGNADSTKRGDPDPPNLIGTLEALPRHGFVHRIGQPELDLGG